MSNGKEDMAHSRIIDCTWNNDTKVASVTRSSQWGVFTCFAKPNEEDMENVSKWIGWQVADYKCMMLIAKKKAEAMRQRYIAISNATNELNQKGNYSLNNFSKIYKQNWVEARADYLLLKRNLKKYCEDMLKERNNFLLVHSKN